ncbi:hypothetical protein BMS3Abin15_01005 [bacterium BMS3Abin15]|nr:hypothetical protein BMS3Abin15_01005 [bacterium BMS3Abin15]
MVKNGELEEDLPYEKKHETTALFLLGLIISIVLGSFAAYIIGVV